MTNQRVFGGHQDGDKGSLGYSPKYKAYHEVYITKDLGSVRNQEVIEFINKNILGFKGKTEDKHGIPVMLFERQADAHKFANHMIDKLNIPKEHIEVKAQKSGR